MDAEKVDAYRQLKRVWDTVPMPTGATSIGEQCRFLDQKLERMLASYPPADTQDDGVIGQTQQEPKRRRGVRARSVTLQ